MDLDKDSSLIWPLPRGTSPAVSWPIPHRGGSAVVPSISSCRIESKLARDAAPWRVLDERRLCDWSTGRKKLTTEDPDRWSRAKRSVKKNDWEGGVSSGRKSCRSP